MNERVKLLLKNEGVSGRKTDITRPFGKLIRDVSTLTEGFSKQKRVNVREYAVKMMP